MEKKTYRTTINAKPEKVWKTLWDNGSYDEWAKVFSVNQPINTDWKKGSKVLFTDGKGSGMVSKIDDSVPNEFMSFLHLGMVKDGVEDTTSDEVKGWAGAHENYILKEAQGKTELEVELDIDEKHKDYFVETFPKALQKVKELAEA